MRAITVSEFGPPSVLVPAEVVTPAPGEGQVLVEVTAAGVGPWDTKMRQGVFGPQEFPYVPGAEVSGIVQRVGTGVDGVAEGDSVLGNPGMHGGYAEYAVLDTVTLTRVPGGLDLESMGGVPIGAVTAIEGLDDHLHATAGDTLLVAGAAGGVGTFVVQIAKARGARVIATASPANHEYLRGLGADEVLDYHGDWIGAAGAVDLAYDCVGGDTWAGCVAALRDGGRAVSIAFFGPFDQRDGVELSSFAATVTTARLDDAVGMVSSGAARVEISDRLSLDDAAEAHTRVETGHTRGKILLLPG